jgi:TatD DNase family protein
MIDAHCHLMDISKDFIPKEFFKLEKIVNSAYCIYTSKLSIEMKKKYPDFLFSTVGLAPQKSMCDISKELKEISSVIEDENKHVDFIGEIGLDYHWADSEIKKKFQIVSFKNQIELAKEFEKPIVLHSRNATKDCIDLLSRFDYGVMFHFYSGNVEEAKEISDRGWLISMPPMKGRLRTKVIEKTEIDNLVCETDAPYVGKTPLDVEKSIEIISEIKEIEKKEVEIQTTKNVLNLFSQ